jgi:hypothetical protein
LLHAREIDVEINIQPAQGQRGDGVMIEEHESLYDSAYRRLYSALDNSVGMPRFQSLCSEMRILISNVQKLGGARSAPSRIQRSYCSFLNKSFVLESPSPFRFGHAARKGDYVL